MKILPVIFWIVGVLVLIIFCKEIGIPLFLILAIIGTIIDYINKKKEMEKKNDYSTSQNFIANKLLGVIVCGILLFIVYLLKVLHVL